MYARPWRTAGALLAAGVVVLGGCGSPEESAGPVDVTPTPSDSASSGEPSPTGTSPPPTTTTPVAPATPVASPPAPAAEPSDPIDVSGGDDPTRADTPDEVAAVLGKLSRLRSTGAISDEEYEAKKRELLDRL